jgi:hypothetical protein
MNRTSARLCSIVALAFAAAPAIALAQDAVLDRPVAELTGGMANGATTANVAAGNANQQANVGLVALGANGRTIGVVAQALNAPSFVSQDGAASADIADNAFAGSNGWIAANVAAGSANQQANIAGIAIGLQGQAVTAAMLSQSRASREQDSASSSDQTQSEYSTRIGNQAFETSSGLVQLNMAAGNNNTSANVFGLSIAAP